MCMWVTLTRLRMMMGEPKRCSIWSKWRPATCAYGSAWSTGSEMQFFFNICDNIRNRKLHQTDQTMPKIWQIFLRASLQTQASDKMMEDATVVASTGTTPHLTLPFTLLTYFHLIYVIVCKLKSNWHYSFSESGFSTCLKGTRVLSGSSLCTYKMPE